MEIVIVLVIIAIIILGITMFKRKGKNKEVEVDTVYSADYSDLELAIITELNNYRREKKIPSVKTHDFISVIAEEHTLNCMRVGKVSHDGAGYRLAEIKNKTNAKGLGEVVAYGFRDAKGVIGGFKRSTSHNRVITGNFNYAGVSAKSQGNKMYVTLILARL